MAVACFLAQEGADINYANHKGKSPLDLVADSAMLQLIKGFSEKYRYVFHQSRPEIQLENIVEGVTDEANPLKVIFMKLIIKIKSLRPFLVCGSLFRCVFTAVCCLPGCSVCRPSHVDRA